MLNLNGIRENFRQFGFNKTIHLYKNKAINRGLFFRQFQAMNVTMETLDHRFLKSKDNLSFRFLTEAEIYQFSKTPAHEIDPNFIKRALENGDRCFAALDGETLASYGWYSTKPTEMGDGLIWNFDPAWVYMYKGYTLPKYRGQKLHAIAMAKALKLLTREGAAGLVSYVETTNFQSLNSVYRMGYKDIDKISVIKLGSKIRIKNGKDCLPFKISINSHDSAAKHLP